MKRLLILLVLLVGCSFSTLWAQSWTSLEGPPLATSIRDITVTTSGGAIYLAEAGYVMKSTNSGGSWAVTPEPYEQPLLVQAKLDDGAKVVAARSGETQYSSDGGASWSQATLPDLEPLRLVNIINAKNIMLLGAEYVDQKISIRRSTDNGLTWGNSSFSNRATDVWDLSPYPGTGGDRAGLVLACGSDPDGTPDGESDEAEAMTSGYWLSHDYGVSWTAGSLGNRQLRSIAVVPTSWPQDWTLLVVERPSSGGDKLLRNAVSGDPAFWSEITLTPAPQEILLIRRNHADGKLYVAADSGVYRSTNSGTSFTRVNNGLGTDIGVVTVEAGGSAGEVYVATANWVYKSTDSGSNWVRVSSMNVSAVESAQGVWAASRENALIGTTSVSGSSWSRVHTGAPGALTQAEHAFRLPATGPYFLAGVEDGEGATLFRSTDLGVSFAAAYQPSTGNDGRFYRLSTDLVAGNDYVYLAGGTTTSEGWKNAFFSSDRGANWYPQSWALGSAYIVDYIVINNSLRYAMLSTGEVRKTIDGGGYWPTSLSASGTGYSLAIAPGSTNTIYAGRSGGLWKSTDAGSSWTQLTDDAAAQRVIMHPGYPNSANDLFILEESGGTTTVSRSTNGGSSWTAVNTGLPRTNDLQATKYSGYLYAATVSGVYRLDIGHAPVTGIAGSGSSGQHPQISWNTHPAADIAGYKIYRSGCNVLNYDQIASVGAGATSYTDEETTIGGGGDGTIRYHVVAYDNYPFTSEPSSTANFDCDTRIERAGEPGGTAMPMVYNLQPAFPNPFNPSTLVRFDLPEPAEVSLTIFDLLGREVANLAAGEYQAGYHTAAWNAAGVAGGVYLARFTATRGSGNPIYRKTARLLLLK